MNSDTGDLLVGQQVNVKVISGGVREEQTPEPTTDASSLLSKRQCQFIIISLVICNFCIANGVSLQGPFFPKEAGKEILYFELKDLKIFFLESKGASPLVYSSIFAIYELVMLVTSFWFGSFVEHFKPNWMSGFGLLMTGISTSVFGVLTHIDSYFYFVSLAYLLRVVESLGATAFATSSYSFISTCFPDKTGTMFATMEMFFGLGVITGPVVGGVLYDVGGFLFPFLSTGIFMTLFGLLLTTPPLERLFLKGKQMGQMKLKKLNIQSPADQYQTLNGDNSRESNDLMVSINTDCQDTSTTTTVTQSDATLARFLLSPIVLIDSFIIITAITLMGFCGATLEPFIRHDQISDNIMHTNLMFVALGASYAFCALLWGKACDKYPSLLLIFSIIGSIMTGIGLATIGPIPYLKSTIKPNLWTISACLVLFGIGTSAKQVAAYTHALNHTIQKRNFPSNQQTYGFLSGMFFSCLSFGGFIGPIIGGALVEGYNFQYATLAMLAIELFVFCILIILQLFCKSFRI